MSAGPDIVARLERAGLAPEAARLIAERGRVLRFPAASVIFRPGDDVGGWIVVVEGSVRVGLTAESGREIVLYRVGAGQPCVLTTSGLLAGNPQPAEAVAETEATVVLVPTATFRLLMGESALFRDQVLAGYAERVADLVLVLEETVFHGIPERLARALLSRAEGGRVRATHQDLAAELGSAREVVTRALKGFESEGMVGLERGAVVVRDPARLEKRARGLQR